MSFINKLNLTGNIMLQTLSSNLSTDDVSRLAQLFNTSLADFSSNYTTITHVRLNSNHVGPWKVCYKPWTISNAVRFRLSCARFSNSLLYVFFLLHFDLFFIHLYFLLFFYAQVANKDWYIVGLYIFKPKDVEFIKC